MRTTRVGCSLVFIPLAALAWWLLASSEANKVVVIALWLVLFAYYCFQVRPLSK